MELEELEEINDRLVYIGETPSQYKDAIVGLTYDNEQVVYSCDRLRQLMMEENGWTDEEAAEWIDCNTARGIEYMGENRPLLINDVGFGEA